MSRNDRIVRYALVVFVFACVGLAPVMASANGGSAGAAHPAQSVHTGSVICSPGCAQELFDPMPSFDVFGAGTAFSSACEAAYDSLLGEPGWMYTAERLQANTLMACSWQSPAGPGLFGTNAFGWFGGPNFFEGPGF
jgi:hypothetical protein